MSHGKIVSEAPAAGDCDVGLLEWRRETPLSCSSIVLLLSVLGGPACQSEVQNSPREAAAAVVEARLRVGAPDDDDGPAWFRSDFGVGRGFGAELVTDWKSVDHAYLSITEQVSEMSFIDRLYVTDTRGSSWRRVPDVADEGQSILGLVTDRNRRKVAYVGLGFPGQLLRTRDGGSTWQDVTAGLDRPRYIQPMAVASGNSQVLYILAAEEQARALELFRSEDRGSTWLPAHVPADRGCCCGQVVAISDEHAYATTTCPNTSTAPGLFETHDGGGSWQPLALDLTFVDALIVDLREPSTLYAANARMGTRVGLRKSTDAGQTWFAPSEEFENRQVSALAIARSGRIFLAAAGDQPGIFVSRDGAGTFISADEGLEGRTITSLVSVPRDRCGAYAIVEGRRVFQTIDGGGSCRR